MPDQGEVFLLPDRTRGAPDAALLDFLRQHSGNPVRISARAVDRLDARVLQLLLSAARSWKERGLDVVLCDVSAPLGRTLGHLGVRPDMLRWEPAE